MLQNVTCAGADTYSPMAPPSGPMAMSIGGMASATMRVISAVMIGPEPARLLASAMGRASSAATTGAISRLSEGEDAERSVQEVEGRSADGVVEGQHQDAYRRGRNDAQEDPAEGRPQHR